MNAVALADQWTRFSATTVGRDKLYRLVQYLAKMLSAWLLTPEGLAKIKAADMSTGARLHRLSVAVGLARKLFRIGKPVDFAQTIGKSLDIQDDVLRLCAIGRSSFLAAWLSLDTLQWLNAHKVIALSNLPVVSKTAARCWFVGLMCAVTSDLYRLRSTQQRLAHLRKAPSTEDATKKEVGTLKRECVKIQWELLQDALDLVIPGSLMDVGFSPSPVLVGAIGTFTSFLGCQAAWPSAK